MIKEPKTYEEIVMHYNNLDVSEEERTYEQILRVYDLADNMINAIELDGVINPEEQTNIAKPVILQMQETADILAKKFLVFVESGKKPNPKLSREIGTAIRKYFAAMDNFNAAAKMMAKNAN